MSDIARPIARGYGRDRASNDRTVQRLADRVRQIPAAWAEAETAATQIIVVGGGNADEIGSGLGGIAYASSLTPSQAYDPDTDTDYDAGLGWGWLYVNGVVQPNKVLVRHDFYPFQAAVLSGWPLVVSGTTVISYDPGGGGAVVDMTAYRFTVGLA